MLKVKVLAESKGWNISRLSEVSGVSYPQTLSIWHNRTRRYDVETLKRIATALDVHVWQLYEGSPPATAMQERIFRVVKGVFPNIPEHRQLDMARWLEDLLQEDVFDNFLKDQLYHRYKTIGDRWEEEARERDAQANASDGTPSPDKPASPNVD